jgi:hypothetical protein
VCTACCNTVTLISVSVNAIQMAANNKQNGTKTDQQHQEDKGQSCMLLTVLNTGRLNKSFNRICTGAVSRSITPLPSRGGGRYKSMHMLSVTVATSVMKLQYLM